MNNIRKNKEKEKEKKRLLAKALRQNILKRKKQQQSQQSEPISKLFCGENFLGKSFIEYPSLLEKPLMTLLSIET